MPARKFSAILSVSLVLGLLGLALAQPPKRLYFTKRIAVDEKELVAEYTVHRGDYLFQILRAHGIPEQDLLQAALLTARLNPDGLRDIDALIPGQTIRIPLTARMSLGPDGAPRVRHEDAVPSTEYVVRPGDSAVQILRAQTGLPDDVIFRTYLRLFRQINPDLKDVDLLYAGQKVAVPLPPAATAGAARREMNTTSSPPGNRVTPAPVTPPPSLPEHPFSSPADPSPFPAAREERPAQKDPPASHAEDDFPAGEGRAAETPAIEPAPKALSEPIVEPDPEPARALATPPAPPAAENVKPTSRPPAPPPPVQPAAETDAVHRRAFVQAVLQSLGYRFMPGEELFFPTAGNEWFKVNLVATPLGRTPGGDPFSLLPAGDAQSASRFRSISHAPVIVPDDWDVERTLAAVSAFTPGVFQADSPSAPGVVQVSGGNIEFRGNIHVRRDNAPMMVFSLLGPADSAFPGLIAGMLRTRGVLVREWRTREGGITLMDDPPPQAEAIYVPLVSEQELKNEFGALLEKECGWTGRNSTAPFLDALDNTGLLRKETVRLELLSEAGREARFSVQGLRFTCGPRDLLLLEQNDVSPYVVALLSTEGYDCRVLVRDRPTF